MMKHFFCLSVLSLAVSLAQGQTTTDETEINEAIESLLLLEENSAVASSFVSGIFSYYDVNVTIVGDGMVSGVDGYRAGRRVTLSATPNEGSVFLGWSAPYSKESATFSFSMPSEDVEIIAYFATVDDARTCLELHDFVFIRDIMAAADAMMRKMGACSLEEVQQMVETNEAFDSILTEDTPLVVEIRHTTALSEPWEVVPITQEVFQLVDGDVVITLPKDTTSGFYQVSIDQRTTETVAVKELEGVVDEVTPGVDVVEGGLVEATDEIAVEFAESAIDEVD